ncbi:epimerase family protein SDR39U1 isoform X2 [Eurytemora carolleeae]|uniref:epimerase family protein SDR39U1 isoform X2 n=1 Tax=Eurytemora carolleeae TaxID=1294199 RepID=UPI000C767CC9|nr:epimerase family protein SDR39U1 isoform X2 [Eurytemora carolleeae]|eukprot:XP_023333173.1 epimerase family protein SDR39U1-like isoform X2 [Eurytemora affinis]
MLSAAGALQKLGVTLPVSETREQKTGFWNLFSRFQLSAEEKGKAINNNTGGLKRPEKVLVGGGSGFIGEEVCMRLRRAGFEVIIISRSPGQHKITWDSVYREGLPTGTKAVINLAGQNVLDPFSRWSPAFKELCRSSRLETTRQLATAVRLAPDASKPKVFVAVTGVGYYAPDQEKVYDEGGAQGSDWLAQLAGEWEAEAKQSGIRTVILRPGVVLGRNGGMIKQIYLPFFLGLGGRMGSGTQPLPWIHVKDLAGLIHHAVETETLEGVYNAVAPQIITNKKFVDTLAGTMGRPAFIPIPEFEWNLIFGEERAAMITKGQKVVPSRSLEAGFKFRFPTIEEACSEFAKFPYLDNDLSSID